MMMRQEMLDFRAYLQPYRYIGTYRGHGTLTYSTYMYN